MTFPLGQSMMRFAALTCGIVRYAQIDISSKIRGPKHRALQSRPTNVSPARLDQQHAARGIFRKARRNRAAGRTSADDNVVIGSVDAAPALTLDDRSGHHLICQCHSESRFYADCHRQMKESASIDLAGRGAPLEAGQEALLLVIAFA